MNEAEVCRKLPCSHPSPVCWRTDTEARAQGRSDFGRGKNSPSVTTRGSMSRFPAYIHNCPSLPAHQGRHTELPPIKLTHRDLRSIPSFTFSSNPNPDRPKTAAPGKLHRTETNPKSDNPGLYLRPPGSNPRHPPGLDPQQPPLTVDHPPWSNPRQPPRPQPPTPPTYQGTIHLPRGPQSSRCHP